MTIQEVADAINAADDGDTVFVDSTSKAAPRMNKAIKFAVKSPRDFDPTVVFARERP